MTKQNGKIQRSKIRSAVSPSSTESGQMEDDRPVPDLSILRKSIQTSITGFTQARDVFDTGTEELKQLLSSECDVIYECRVCRNLFRSLANFISHKRVYCRQKFNTSLHAHFINNKFLKDDMMMILQNEQDYQQFLKNKDRANNNAHFNIDNTIKKTAAAKDLTSIVERLASKNRNTSNMEDKVSNTAERLIKFESISSSPTAVYQNVCSSKKDLQDLIKDQVTELDNMISSREAVLGPDGKLLISTPSPASNLPKIVDNVIQISDEDDESSTNEIVCKICKIKFSTLKTLRFHMKHKHTANRLVFPCPDCSDTFANAWGVYRHLFKVHRKSAAHIRKLRESIQNKAYRLQKAPETEKKKDTSEVMESISEQHRMDLENQAWMDNLEGDGEVPRCGGCGRRFERRAALSSHRQTCQLRIAAHNKITSNMQRRTATKVVSKEPETPRILDLEPRIKIAKIDIKPSEKTIEIQIRRDYNKGSTASPVSAGTNSPVSESAGDGDVVMLQQCSGESAGKGENGGNLKSIINVDLQNISDKCNTTETVKDCDDAYVNNTNSSVSLDDGKELVDESKTNIIKDSSVFVKDVDSTYIDDSELSFEDIKRICHLGDSSQRFSKDHAEVLTIVNPETKPSEIIASSASEINLGPTEDSSGKLVPDMIIESDYNNEIENTKALDAQIDSQSDEKLFCKDCDVGFLSIVSFRKHMAKHFDWKRFKCKLCHFKSYNKSHCVNHLRYQHKLSGDANRLKTFIRALSPEEACAGLTSSEKQLPSEKSTCNHIVVNLSDDDNDEMKIDPLQIDSLHEQPIPADSTPTKQETDSENIINAETSSSPSNSVSSSNNEGSTKKRGRPKGSFKCLKKKRNSSNQSGPSSVEVTPKKVKDKVSTPVKKENSIGIRDMTETQSSVDNYTSQNTKPNLPCNITLTSGADSIGIKQDAKEEVERNLNNQHTASSTSSTVKRPIRNRVKPINKDFEYDLSNLLKLEAEAYKESHMTSNISQKNQLKRKPLLQNEIIPVDHPIETGAPKEQPKTKEPSSPKAPISITKSCLGALQSASLRAAHRGRALMKQTQSLTTRRDLPPFIMRSRNQLSASMRKLGTAKSPPVTPLLTSPTKGSIKTTPVMTAGTNSTKSSVPQSTPLMISETLSLDKYPQKIGTPTASTPPSNPIPHKIETTPKSYPSKKQSKGPLQSLSPRLSKNKTETFVQSKQSNKKPHDSLDNKSLILECMSKNFSVANINYPDVSDIKSEPDEKNCNSSSAEVKLDDQAIKDNSNIKKELSELSGKTCDRSINVSVISFAKGNTLKENDKTSSPIHCTKIVKAGVTKNKDLVNVKDLKSKLAHYLTLSQAKSTSENTAVMDCENSTGDAHSPNHNNEMEKSE